MIANNTGLSQVFFLVIKTYGMSSSSNSSSMSRTSACIDSIGVEYCVNLVLMDFPRAKPTENIGHLCTNALSGNISNTEMLAYSNNQLICYHLI